MSLKTLLLLAASLLATGCASIVSGTNQPVSVETRGNGGALVAGANCKLSNNKGTWFVTTPGTTTVNRSYEALNVRCEKDGSEPGLAVINSSTKGMAFGNILFGGPIGAGVDMASGAAYDYPNLITVMMGSNTTVGTPAPEPPKK
jgi:hypothetical protein